MYIFSYNLFTALFGSPGAQLTKLTGDPSDQTKPELGVNWLRPICQRSNF